MLSDSHNNGCGIATIVGTLAAVVTIVVFVTGEPYLEGILRGILKGSSNPLLVEAETSESTPGDALINVPTLQETATATPLPPTPTGTSTPSPTESPIPTPTPTPTSIPPTPTPTPLGRGGVIRGNGLSVELVDYEFRPKDHTEDAAVAYRLAFINETGNSIEVAFNHHDISGVDNLQTLYGDYFALAEQWYDDTGRYQCVSVQTLSYPTNKEFIVPPNSEVVLDLYLNVVGTEGDCSNWGVGRSRVSFETNYIDLAIDRVRYRTDQLYELSDLEWRLTR